MALTNMVKKEVMSEYQRSKNDTGSSQVQVALLTTRIKSLTEHLKVHKKDKHTRYGLQKLINRRRKLLDYLKSCDMPAYADLIKRLGLRR